MRKGLALLLALCLTAGLCGCAAGAQEPPAPEPATTEESAPSAESDTGPEAAAPGATTFTDALGQVVAVENPQRVAALMGSFAEIWTLAGGELCAVTDDAYEDRGIDIPQGLPSVGTFNAPNVEALIACDPDLVLLSSETQGHVELQALLENAGIQTAYFSVTHFEDYLGMLDTCTTITGRRDLYEENGLRVQGEIGEILSQYEPLADTTALVLITYSGGARAQNGATMPGRMLLEFGCDNLADLDPSLLREFSVEHIIAADPDYIFVIPQGNTEEAAQQNLREGIEANPAWSSLTAVQEGRYLLLPKELFQYKPNVRWAESYAYLAEILYG